MAKVLLVTGSRTGLGRALAEHYLAQGWQVVGCSRQPCELVHPAYAHYTLDVAQEEDVVAMVRQVARQYGRIDALLNNAGIARMNALALTPVSTARSLFETNLLGAFVAMREVAKVMLRQRQGRIVNFSTVAVPWALEGEALYAASKAALATLTRVAAREWGPAGITVNTVAPNPIRTALLAGVSEEGIRRLLARQAIPRLGEPADVINVVDFFLRPESSFITGQTLYLGGVSE